MKIDTTNYDFLIFMLDGFSKLSEELEHEVELIKMPACDYMNHKVTKQCCEVIRKKDGDELGYGGFDLSIDQVNKLFSIFNIKEEVRDLDYQFQIFGL